MNSAEDLLRSFYVPSSGHRFKKFLINLCSQCSTVVRNTVVRASIKVNGKPQILDTHSPHTGDAEIARPDIARLDNVRPCSKGGHRET